MRRGPVSVLMLTVLAASASAAGAEPALRIPRIATPDQPAPTPPRPQPIPPPAGPCLDARVRCPDLVVRAPSDLRVRRGRSGRTLLGSRNIIVNRGAGPLFLEGERIARRRMRVRQRIYTERGAHRTFRLRGARLDFWFIPGQGRYWKLRDGMRFELWTSATPLPRRVRVGVKTRFCMRDLFEVGGMPGPRSRKFPACSQDADRDAVRMGISVGWAESYPAFYHEQYVDVTGLDGCFELRHIVDPRERVLESDESNNMARRTVRLPARGGRVRRCG
jgi:hypothetical protein